MEKFNFVGEIKKLALKAQLDKDFYRMVVPPKKNFEKTCKDFPLLRLAKTGNYINTRKIADDFARFLERLLEAWNGSLEMPIDEAIYIMMDSIESNTFWWLADKNNSRDPYKVTIALFESINYYCWYYSYYISIDDDNLRGILQYPIAIDWSKYNN